MAMFSTQASNEQQAALVNVIVTSCWSKSKETDWNTLQVVVQFLVHPNSKIDPAIVDFSSVNAVTWAPQLLTSHLTPAGVRCEVPQV